MSASFRAKLVTEIKNNVAGRLGGQYFDYVTIKVKRKTYEKLLKKKLEKQKDKSSELNQMTTVDLTGEWADIGKLEKNCLKVKQVGIIINE